MKKLKVPAQGVQEEEEKERWSGVSVQSFVRDLDWNLGDCRMSEDEGEGSTKVKKVGSVVKE